MTLSPFKPAPELPILIFSITYNPFTNCPQLVPLVPYHMYPFHLHELSTRTSYCTTVCTPY